MKWENSLRSQKMLQFHVQFSISLSLTYSHIHALTHSLSHTQTFTVFLDLPTYLSVSLDLFNTLLSVSLSHLPTLSPSLSFFLSFFLSRSCWCKTLVHTTCLKSHTLWLDQRELNPAGYLPCILIPNHFSFRECNVISFTCSKMPFCNQNSVRGGRRCFGAATNLICFRLFVLWNVAAPTLQNFGQWLWLCWWSACYRFQRSSIWIKSWAKLTLNVYCQLYWKDENKQKEAWNGQFFKNNCSHWLWLSWWSGCFRLHRSVVRIQSSAKFILNVYC